jgi:uncharacterized phage infection (PIP) family protein YhgE
MNNVSKDLAKLTFKTGLMQRESQVQNGLLDKLSEREQVIRQRLGRLLAKSSQMLRNAEKTMKNIEKLLREANNDNKNNRASTYKR